MTITPPPLQDQPPRYCEFQSPRQDPYQKPHSHHQYFGGQRCWNKSDKINLPTYSGIIQVHKKPRN